MSWLSTKQKKTEKELEKSKKILARIKGEVKILKERMGYVKKKIDNALGKASNYKKKGDKKNAILMLNKKKMRQSEYNKMFGMQVLLQQQIIELEGVCSDANIINTIQEGTKAIERISQLAGIEDFEKLMDETEEQKERIDELNNFMDNYGTELQEELTDDYDQLESDEFQEEVKNIKVPTSAIGSVANSNASEENFEQLLEKLMS
eukprot:TRINITY_DN5720_c0_g6_i2.p1 TRINITY_DN5720_c0_g6~~TRINITY_DN5720_c0_g6_i2.p1  ORF type:complete len:206 (+),score=42.41 TRINITY_DN5720_c0_g6_i2:184-801(+)